MSIEIEAKFNIPNSATYQQLTELAQIGAFQIRYLKTKQIADRYLDTSDRQIAQAGYACRIRDDGKKLVLTLKSLNLGQDGLHQREEFETTIPSLSSNEWSMIDVVVQKFRELSQHQPVEELFHLEQSRRKSHVLRDGQSLFELSLDVVQLPQVETTYYELEAETLIPDVMGELAEFCRLLRERYPSLTPEPRSKFERGLASCGITLL